MKVWSVRARPSSVARRRRMVIARTERPPWLLLPLVMLPVAAATFLLVRWALSRCGRTSLDATATLPVDVDLHLTVAASIVAESEDPAGAPASEVPAGSAYPDFDGAGPAASPAHASPAGTAESEDHAVRHVGDLMRPVPEAIEYDAFITIAEARMRELGVDALPVVADGTLAGIVTRDDLAPPLAGGEAPKEHDRVADCMSADPVTVSSGSPVEEAMRLMAGHGVHHLVVVDGARPVGILSLAQTEAAPPAGSA